MREATTYHWHEGLNRECGYAVSDYWLEQIFNALYPVTYVHHVDVREDRTTEDVIWVCTDCENLITNDGTKYEPHAPSCRFGSDPKPYVPQSTLIALQEKLKIATEALKKSHACATVRDDGSCDGCYVSEALSNATGKNVGGNK